MSDAGSATPDGSWWDAHQEMRQSLERELSSLCPGQRAAFAATCAERMYPHYDRVAGLLKVRDAELLREMLDRIWQHALGYEMSPEEFERLEEVYRSAELGEEDFCEGWFDALDALGAAWLALQVCKSGSVERAAGAAQIVLDCLGAHLYDEVAPGLHSLSPSQVDSLMRAIQAHPKMLAERRRQEALLRYLQEHPQLTEADVAVLRQL